MSFFRSCLIDLICMEFSTTFFVQPAPIETPNPTQPPVTPNPTEPPETPNPTDESERNKLRENDEELTASASIL